MRIHPRVIVIGAFAALFGACVRSPQLTEAESEHRSPEDTLDEPEVARVVVPAPEPDDPDPLSPRERDARGDEHLFAGRFTEAIADFDALLEAEPALDPYHWRRGIAYYYAGRYADGAAQFVRHRTVNPDDVENAAWHFLCIARGEGVEKARAALLPVGPDSREPMKKVYELFAGRAKAEDVLAVAASSAQRDAPFFAHLYLGLYSEALGDTAKAREHIELAATTHGRAHYMGSVAKVHAALFDE